MAIQDKQIDALPIASIINDADSLAIAQEGKAKQVKGSVFKGLVNVKVDKPKTSPNGQAGQLLRSKGNGETEWITPATPTDAQIDAALDEWMTAHPEYWASVQDDSISEAKLTSDVKKKLLNGFVTPQMFGADGTDDTDAFQAACDYAGENSMGVLVYTNHYLTRTITVPNFIPIIALARPEYRPPQIRFSSNIGTVFRCTVGNYFENLSVRATTNSWQPVTAFEISGNSSLNADVSFYNVQIVYCEYGIVGYGRNIDVNGGLISHCRYGIHFYLPNNSAYGYRGMVVKNVRFHGIGEEFETVDGQQVEMLLTGNTACIIAELDNPAFSNPKTQVSDLIIDSCIADQGATLFKGYAQFVQITNNYVKTFAMPHIVLDGWNDSANASAHSPVYSVNIDGNVFIGNLGSDGAGVSHDYPTDSHIISNVQHYLNITNNMFMMYNKYPIVLTSTQRCIISNNNFSSVYSPTENPLVLLRNNCQVVISNNISRSNHPLFGQDPNAKGSCSASISGNLNCTYENVETSTGTRVRFDTQPTKICYLGAYTLGEANFPYHVNDFDKMIRKTDGKTAFIIHFLDNYMTSTVLGNVKNNVAGVEWLEFNSSDQSLHLKRFNGSTIDDITNESMLVYDIRP